MILLAAVGIDVKWSKNRGKAIQKIYVNPAYVALAPAPSVQPRLPIRPTPRTTG